MPSLTNEDQKVVNAAPKNTSYGLRDASGASVTSTLSAKGAAVTVNADGSLTYDLLLSSTLQSLAAGESTTDTYTYYISETGTG